MNSDNSEEIFPVVDAAGNVVGKATRGECHGGSMLLHPVVHLHVFNSRGELYLQKRPAWKDIQPGRWDTAVGGHVDYGETIAEALRREVREELGITDFVPGAVAVYPFRSEREYELVHVFRTVYDGEETDDAYYAEDYIADRKSRKKQRRKGSGGLVLLLLGELAGIAGIIWWWIKWLS